MTAVRIAFERPDRAPAYGSVEFAPTRRRVDGTTVVGMAPPIQVQLGPDPVTVDLDPTGGDWCWSVLERVAGLGQRRRYLLVPDVEGPVEYAALVEVDPATLEPSAEPPAAWTLELDAVRDEVADRAMRDHTHTTADITDLPPPWSPGPGGVQWWEGDPWASTGYAVGTGGFVYRVPGGFGRSLAIDGAGVSVNTGDVQVGSSTWPAAAGEGGFTTLATREWVDGQFPALDGTGKISPSVLPPLAVSEHLGPVASEAEMHALDAQTGDVCNRTDEQRSYMKSGPDPEDWTVLLTPPGVQIGPSGHTDPGMAVGGNDPRLTDDRNPTAHTHSWPDITDKPAVIAAGDDAAEARAAIGALSVADTGADSTQRLMAVLRNETSDASILVVGDSTGNEPSEWVYRLTGLLASQWPSWTVHYRLWNDASGSYDPAVSIQTGTGSRTLTIYNASVAGFTTNSWLGPRAEAAIFALDPKLTIISLGHNEQADAGLWHGRYVALTEEITQRLPGTDLLLILQNPATANANQQARNEVYREIAARRGYGLVDVQQAFLDTGNAPGLTVDGIHPNTAGSILWADTVAAAFVHQPRSPRPQLPSSLTEAADNLLVNGGFDDFGAPVPAHWEVSNATCSKDTVDFESGRAAGPRGAYAVKLTATGSGSLLSQYVPVRRAAGHWVTLAVRLRVPPGSAATVGRIAISDSAGSSVALAEVTSHGRWRWAVVSRFIAPGATYCRALIYCDTGNTGATITVDRAIMTIGKFPHDSA